jgi:hypothetical protein
LLSKKKIVPILAFFGSQEAVKKFGPKIGFFLVWTSHPSGISTVNWPPNMHQILAEFELMVCHHSSFQQNNDRLNIVY